MKEVNLNGETIGNLRVILECLALGLKGKKASIHALRCNQSLTHLLYRSQGYLVSVVPCRKI